LSKVLIRQDVTNGQKASRGEIRWNWPGDIPKEKAYTVKAAQQGRYGGTSDIGFKV
jgi:hypothetical protein